MTNLENSLLAINRAVRPDFRNKHDKLVFAVNSYMLVEGCKLIAVGRSAEDLKELDEQAPEVGLESWQESEDNYCFAYTRAKGKGPPVLLKALKMDDELVVMTHEQGSNTPPQHLNLKVNTYVENSLDPVEGYKNLRQLTEVLGQLASGSKASQSDAATQKAAGKQSRESTSPLHEGPPEGLVPLPTPGSSDLLPPGIPRDITGIPGVSGGGLLEPTGVGIPGQFPAGMHVGPHDPLFTGRTRPRPGFGQPEGPFPGVRYDPVNPEGLEGFNAQDFQRARQFHPDIMPPGRGGGSDFDSMFG